MKLFIASGLLAMGFAASKLTGSHESTRRVNADNNVITAPSSPLSTKKENDSISSHESDNVLASTSSNSNVDVGLLSKNFEQEDTPFIPSISRGLSSHTTCINTTTVNCTMGMNAANLSQTCTDACDYGVSCCSGDKACDDFTGEVCKDGSCSGDLACYYARIGLVTQESCVGERACYSAGYDGGIIGVISNSCKNGNRTCKELAEYGGNVSRIVNSCKDGNEACEFAAEYFDDYGPGTIEAIEDSCFGFRSCYNMAADGGTVGPITESCVGDQSCESAAEYGGMIEQGIVSSCIGNSSCSFAAYNGTVLGFNDACNAVQACKKIGEDDSISFTSQVVDDCCNAAYQCNTTIQVQDQCFPPPTSSPTSSPTPAPTQAPTGKPSIKPTPESSSGGSVEPSKAGKQGKEGKEAKAGKQAKTVDEKVDVNIKRTRPHASGGQDGRAANLRAASDKQR